MRKGEGGEAAEGGSKDFLFCFGVVSDQEEREGLSDGFFGGDFGTLARGITTS